MPEVIKNLDNFVCLAQVNYGKNIRDSTKHPESYIVLHGYTDDVGSQTYNLSLSRKRVESVYSYLTGDLGVDHARVITMWYGEANPTASNSNDTGRALNRRVEIAVGGLM